MKKILVALIIGSTLFSCSNDDDSQHNSALIGTWVWTSSSGGIAGIEETPQSTGDTRIIEISANSIKRYRNGTLESQINYLINTSISIIYNDSYEMIIQENEFKFIFEITGSNLVLIEDCIDCFTHEYVKQ